VLVGLLLAGALIAACSAKEPLLEGDDPGECADGADNDVNRLYDCDDPGCIGSPDCPDLHYPTEANLFDELPSGEAQLASLCIRMAASDTRSVVRDVFCVEPRPVVTSTQELLSVLGLGFNGPGGMDAQIELGSGNPSWAVLGHSAALSRRVVNPVNPRVIVHTEVASHYDPTPGFVAIGLVRGEGFAEIITHDPVRDDLDFFLFQFTYRCAVPEACTDEERFSEQYESGWLGYTLYGVQDLENTILDCLPCHEKGLISRPANPRSPLMFQLNSMWMHWMYDNQHFRDWTDPTNFGGAGPFHEAMQQYVAAHGTNDEPLGETFGGVPNGAIYASRPKSLEELIEANGYGNGFDRSTYEPNGADIGLLENDRARGMLFSHVWQELYELNLNGLMITPPGPGEEPFNRTKLLNLIDDYSAYRNGATTEFPDVTDVFEEANLGVLGLKVMPGLSPPEILVQACTQCHHDGLNQSISRAQFTLGPIARSRPASSLGDHFSNLKVGELHLIQERINLPADHLQVMPPDRIRSLDLEERAAVTAWLDTLIAGYSLPDDGEPPSPLLPEFDIPPSEVEIPGPYFGNTAGIDHHQHGVQHTMVVMRAVPGSDPGGYVEYYFEETSGSPGGSSSGWQLSPRYLDTEVLVGETYSYRFKMRDRAGNEGEFSQVLSFEMGVTAQECVPAVGDQYPLTPGMDSDCDVLLDEEEGDGDTDGDGIPDYRDPDDDGDGFSTWTEHEDGDRWGEDIDGDGIPNWHDTDSDGDTYSDALEGGGDFNNNLIPAYLDPAEPCGNGDCNEQDGPWHENCLICPADCGCDAGTTCVDTTCQ